jgi:hypothetical protein
MTEFSAVSLKIETVGDREALASLNALDAAGRRIVDSVSGKLGKSLGDVAAAFTKAGEAGRDAFRSVAVQADMAADASRKAASAVQTVATAHGKAGVAAMGHGLQLGRLRMELGTLLGRLTGTNTALDRMGGAIASMALGDPIVIGALAGVAALAAGYQFLTKNAREAEKALQDVRKRAAEAANSGKADDLQEMARQLTFGTPFTGEGKNLKMMAASTRVKGAFSGSIADLQAQRRELDAGIAAAPNMFVASHLAQQEKKLDAVLNPMLQRLAVIQAASENLASQPADNAGKLPGMTVSAFSDDAIAKRTKKQHDAMVKQYLDLLKQRKQTVTDMANSAADEDDDTLDPMERLNRSTRREDRERGVGKVNLELPDMKELNGDVVKAGHEAAGGIKDNPFLKQKAAFDKSVKDLAKHMHEELGRTLGAGLSAGFEAAFSGKGIGEGFKTLTATVLSGLGSFLEQLGAGMLVTGTWLEAFSESMHSLNGPGAIAAGVGLIAAGAAMKAIAGSFGGGGSSGSGGGGYSGSSGLAQIIDRGTINPGAYSTATTAPAARPNVSFPITVLNPNDGVTQRLIDDINRKILQNGSLAGAR